MKRRRQRVRWYVLENSHEPDIPAYLVAEVVAEIDDDGTTMLRDSPVLCGDRNLLSRDELLASDEGRRALIAWESGEDSAFEEAARRLLATAIAEDERMFSTGSLGA